MMKITINIPQDILDSLAKLPYDIFEPTLVQITGWSESCVGALFTLLMQGKCIGTSSQNVLG
jgi:hypothetical protein